MAASESEALLLHALRVKGAAGVADLEAASGVEGAAARVEPLLAAGLLSRAGEGEGAILGLTPAGRERDAELVAGELDDGGRERLGAAYENDFLPVNVDFKTLCAQWQSEGESFELLERLLGQHQRVDSFLAGAADAVPRLGRYRERLGAALERVQDGDGEALVGAIGPSYHNVWFELHEDLIATLGRSRADEEG
jgi:hypothetical protein